MPVQVKRERKRNQTNYDFYSNQRNIISSNLTFLFIGHWEQAMNFHCMAKKDRMSRVTTKRNSFLKLFEMVARIILWLYKTSNMDKVRTSFKFFLDEIAAHRNLTILSYSRLSC